jgi:ABC-type antimicrobial peptide transport system permease subunit
MYVPWWHHTDHITGSVNLMIRTGGDPAVVIAPARERLRALNPLVPASFTPLRVAVAASVADRAFVMWVLVGFGVAGLVLAVVGIVGVVSYTVAHRRREIGIRLALGARQSRVRAEVRGDALITVALGVAMGVAVSFGLVGLMEGLLYDVPARDPWTFVGVAALVLAAAAAASDVPARRTARVAPAEVLRE